MDFTLFIGKQVIKRYVFIARLYEGYILYEHAIINSHLDVNAGNNHILFIFVENAYVNVEQSAAAMGN